MPSVTKVKVVPPCLVTGSRAWWVRMNTAVWKGGSSPHQPSAFGSSSHGPLPPLNIRLPITVAPVLRTDSSMTSESGLVLPPSRPWRSRQPFAPGPTRGALRRPAQRLVERLVWPRGEPVE